LGDYYIATAFLQISHSSMLRRSWFKIERPTSAVFAYVS
jgi:hypothetical protein